MSFAEQIADLSPAELSALIERSTPDDVRRALASERISADGLLALLSPVAETMLEQIAQRAHEVTRQYFGGTVLLYAPLYLSNECDNGCVYCGFSARNDIERRTLTVDEAVREGESLRARGFRHVLLLTGEAPRAIDAEKLAAIVRRVGPLFDSVSLEVFPMEEAGYETAVAAGVDGLTVYQETYDRDVYAAMHPTGRKRDYDFRLEAPERGAAAGMRRVGVGALLGLADFRADSYLTALHAAYLTRRHWRAHLTVSFPRLRDAEGGFSAPTPVSDRQLVLALCATRLFLPHAGLVLSTREEASLRDRLLPFGITQMSAGSRTQPGGYEEPEAAGRQFAISDDRTPEEVCAAIRRAGYDPVWKDWDPAFTGAAI